MQPSLISIDHQDLNGALSWMSHICGPHSLEATSPGKVAFAHVGHRLGSMSTTLGRIQYGTDVTVGLESAASLNSYSLSLPSQGQQELSKDGRSLLSDQHLALVISPQQSQQLSISGDCNKIQIAITRQAMRSVAEHLLQRPLQEPVYFEPLMDATQGKTAAWWRLAGFHLQELTLCDDLYSIPGVAHDLETALIKALLIAQPNNYSQAIREAVQTRIPHYLKLARDFIESNAREDLRLDDIEQAAGISRFKLFEEFRAHFGCSPMHMLKQVRLESARREMLEDGGNSNVSAIAMGWGFNHLGRFSSDYHRAFGEYPSATLARHAPRRSR